MTNHPNRSRHPVTGTARRAFPGDPVYIMLRKHMDEDGELYPKGTEYTLLSSGADEGLGTYQDVTISGETRRFVRP